MFFSEASESSAGLSLPLASISELEVDLRSPVSIFSAPLKTTQRCRLGAFAPKLNRGPRMRNHFSNATELAGSPSTSES